MIFNLVNKYKYLLPAIYAAFGVVLLGVLALFFCAQFNCLNCSLATVNPSFFLMPILTYGSIGLVGLTIGFTRKTASEKNALDFDKFMSELNDAFKVIGVVRKKMLLPNSDLDRRKATAYMQELEAAVLAERAKMQAPEKVAGKPADEKADAPVGSVLFMCSSNNAEAENCGSNNFIYYGETPSESKKPAEKTVSLEPTAMEVWAAAGKILNSFEGCANAIRYGIYDEDFIYNVYGSQFINFYELTYGLIKSRQVELPRAWVNFEWLAVKWTLRRKITGVVSKEWEETSYIIQESLAAIKEHTKVRPDPKKLQGFMDKLERRKFPA
ncbi:DUF4760 domain-containing protein [Pseudomonas fluorescens]|uniref:DUF4760 domain-containing protein n=1 Tax=Pseudomonas fluorescens TaxID=294 RepID=UPI00380C3588